MVDPAARKSSDRYVLWIGLFIVGLVLGVSFGLWVGTHYRVVPIAPVAVSPELSAPQEHADAATSEGTTPEVPVPALPTGPYSFRFTPEELLKYRIDTTISGTGMDAGLASDVSMDFVGDFSLYTKTVDDNGVADLRLLFDDATLQGNFLGAPFEMGYDQNRAYIYDGRTTLDTARGDSMQDIPQMEFFKQPISLRVAPNGQVLDVSGQAGLAGMLTALPALARVEFPDNAIQDGTQWESRIQMPVPGFGAAVDTRILNTLIGYEYVGTKYCAVIRQDFGATQTDGRLHAPESALGDAVDVSVPLFDLQGQNVVYFDVSNGQLVHTVIDLNLTMNFGKMLSSAAGIFGELGKSLLGGDLGGLDENLKPEDTAPDILDLSLGIQGAITQVDPAQEALAPSPQ